MENLGKKGKDKITGFEGIVTAKCFHLYGCAQYCLNPPVDKDGKSQESKWIDEGRLEVVGQGIDPKSVQVEENGCEDQPHP